MSELPKQAARALLPRLQAPGTSEVEVILVPGQLAVAFVVDTRAGWLEVGPVTLAEWGVSATELMEPAVENLRRLSTPHAWIDVVTVPGVRIYHAADGMGAARLLILDTLLRPLPAEGVIVAVPSPDQLLCVTLDGPGSTEALTVMLAASGLAVDNTTEPLSDQAYWFDGTWLRPLEVRHTEEEVEMVLPPELKAALHRLSSLLYGMVAEA